MTDKKYLLKKWIEDKEPVTYSEVRFLMELEPKEFAEFMNEYHRKRGCCKELIGEQ